MFGRAQMKVNFEWETLSLCQEQIAQLFEKGRSILTGSIGSV